MKQKILITIFILLAVTNVVLLFFLLQNRGSILVSNQNPNYTLSYQKSSQFENLIIKWGIWNKQHIQTTPQDNRTKIKSITLTLVDHQAQPALYTHYDGPDKKNVLLSTSFSVEDQKGAVYIYIKPQTVTSENREYFNAILFQAVIKTLFDNRNPNVDSSELEKAIERISNKTYKNPFTISNIE